MSGFEFFKQGLKNLRTIGTVTRTSGFASRSIINLLEFERINGIVELGSGDGAITKYLLESMKPDSKLLAFEVNSQFCKSLRALNDPRLIVIQDSAANLENYLAHYGLAQVDAIVSALPFAIIPDEITHAVSNSCKKCLKTGGSFVQIHYSLKRKHLYESIFGKVKVKFIPLNIPPLFVIYNVLSCALYLNTFKSCKASCFSNSISFFTNTRNRPPPPAPHSLQ
jgi:phospholipid N-methyltransferase